MIENGDAAVELIGHTIGSKPFEYWRQHLKPRAAFQCLIDFGHDEQAVVTDMLVELEAADGGAPCKVIRGPADSTTNLRRRLAHPSV